MFSPNALANLPQESREHVKMLLNCTAELRPDAFQTSKLPMFEDVGVKTLQYLDSLYQWDNLQKSQFYRGLPQIIAKMPKRVNLHRIIPCLAKEYHTPEMVPFVLPNVLLVSEDATKEEFQSLILPDIIPLFRLQEPVQITLIFMQKMELLLSKCPQAVIANHVLPMVYRALESDAQQIQELCLSIIPKFASLIEYSAMKNALLPRIKKLCISTSYLSVRVNCLVCIGKLLEHLDKWLVLDEILPFLPQIPSKEPAVLMGVLGKL
ncbi:SCY1-like protein 2 [Araneus ventricosus]|uniref:SCY1-like protein 2 n=1 Tax=Araneus ventricosus TaxID=182803 RepID=A0A4Y2R7M4_ARAVE|nr:SCY1-like protein 2 [Araneus ventricosus]